jgi:glycogen synthase
MKQTSAHSAPRTAPARLRLALAAWEIGRASSGFGVKIGGLGHVLEELPAELVRAAAAKGIDLEIELLSPCFGHYRRELMVRLPLRMPALAAGEPVEFELFEHRFVQRVTFPDGEARDVRFRGVYFWNQALLGWTHARAVYPGVAEEGLRLYAAVSCAMAGYVRQAGFDTLHLHDYHVGLIPFFNAFAARGRTADALPTHLTLHNGSYQGVTPAPEGGANLLDGIGLPGAALFDRYFEFYGHVNLLKATMLLVHERGGRITTVSGDLDATWGYAAELRESQPQLQARATALLGRAPKELFLPNHHCDVFEKLPIAGITNGLGEKSRAARMPELQATYLRQLLDRRGGVPLFRESRVQEEMLARDHTFDADHLEPKAELRRLLYAEVFGGGMPKGAVLLSAVGRLVQQKNFGLIADAIPRLLATNRLACFVLMGSAESNDVEGQKQQARFRGLAARYPRNVRLEEAFDPVLAKLVTAGSDFALVPSRFEPCGLTDWEAALVGTIPICHATGGLTKIRHCGYLYEWLDIGDWWGEVELFVATIHRAVRVLQRDPAGHQELMRAALRTPTSWDEPARQYVEIYLAGLAARVNQTTGASAGAPIAA